MLASLNRRGSAFFFTHLLFLLSILSVINRRSLFQALMRMRALQIRCVAQEVVVKRLRIRLAEGTNQIKVCKEAIRTLNGEVNAQKAKVS